MPSPTLTSFLAASLLLSSVSATCYNPSGTRATWPPNMKECNSGTDFTSCCGENDECYTNGLCKGEGDGSINWFYRYGCTDQRWGASCPQVCMESDWWRVYQCTETTFCCAIAGESLNVASNYSCCNMTDRAFTAQPPEHLAGPRVYIASIWTNNPDAMRPAPTSRVQEQIPASSVAETPAEETRQAESSANEQTPESSAIESAASSASEASETGSVRDTGAASTRVIEATAPPLPTSTTSSSSASQDSSTSSNGMPTAAKAGMGVGIALGVAIIGLLGWFIWRQKQARENGAKTKGAGDHGGEGAYGVAGTGAGPMSPLSPPGYYGGDAKVHPVQVTELGTSERYELGTENVRYEMGQGLK